MDNNVTERQDILRKARALFFDAQDYEENILIGYYRLLYDLFGEELRDAICEIVLAQLINVCWELKEQQRKFLMLKYGLDGSVPLELEEMAEVLKLPAIRIPKVAKKIMVNLKVPEVVRRYNIREKAEHIRNARKQANSLSEEQLQMTIEELQLSTMTFHALRRTHIYTVGQLVDMSFEEMASIRELGTKGVEEIARSIQNICPTWMPLRTPIEALDFSTRTFNCLKSAGIKTVDEVFSMSKKELLKINKFGDKCVEEVFRKKQEFLSTGNS